ncbi:SMI1/KNR4 family protein [Deinococcus radiomollis]|uniref:SMI1/KNR4 family protein n=1 Tax=Deinococcus radiomollis TaxID=468916 RepID=UPI0038912F77
MGIRELLKISSPDLLPAHADQPILTQESPLYMALMAMLSTRNGFYSLESSIHVYSLSGLSAGSNFTLERWNKPELWKDAYSGVADNIFCFGQDLFGNQYCFSDERICLFDAETAELEYMAATLDEWAELVMNDNYWSGHSLAHSWQAEYGAVTPGHRLIPKLPFILGGKFEAANLHCFENVKAMHYRAELFIQMRDTPDNTQVKLKII